MVGIMFELEEERLLLECEKQDQMIEKIIMRKSEIADCLAMINMYNITKNKISEDRIIQAFTIFFSLLFGSNLIVSIAKSALNMTIIMAALCVLSVWMIKSLSMSVGIYLARINDLKRQGVETLIKKKEELEQELSLLNGKYDSILKQQKETETSLKIIKMAKESLNNCYFWANSEEEYIEMIEAINEYNGMLDNMLNEKINYSEIHFSDAAKDPAGIHIRTLKPNKKD